MTVVPVRKPDPSLERPYRTLFVVGSPRSGTTWLQLLLDQSPRVATAPETQIFAYYLDHFRKQWIEEHEGVGARLQGRAGLSRLLSDEEFLGLCGRTAREVLDRIAADNPAASVVVEKSPRHAVLVEWILSIFPDAWILHVVRDPRDAAASMVKAGWSWGAAWAPRNPIDAGRLWLKHVNAARAARDLTPNYREIRYEDLRADTAPELQSLLRWLGLPADDEFVAEAIRNCDLKRLRKDADGADLPVPGKRSPKGFFGKGSVGGWRETLGARGGRLVESVCYDTMISCGYQPEQVRNGRPTTRIVLHDAVRRIRESIDWQLQRLLFRL